MNQNQLVLRAQYILNKVVEKISIWRDSNMFSCGDEHIMCFTFGEGPDVKLYDMLFDHLDTEASKSHYGFKYIRHELRERSPAGLCHCETFDVVYGNGFVLRIINDDL